MPSLPKCAGCEHEVDTEGHRFCDDCMIETDLEQTRRVVGHIQRSRDTWRERAIAAEMRQAQLEDEVFDLRCKLAAAEMMRGAA